MMMVQNMLCLFTVTKGKGNTDLYFVKQCCWLLCKQKFQMIWTHLGIYSSLDL